MKKSILLTLIFGLGILFSVPKAEAVNPTVKRVVIGALGAALTTFLIKEIHEPIKTIKAANLEEALNKIEKKEKLQRLCLFLISCGIGLANGAISEIK